MFRKPKTLHDCQSNRAVKHMFLQFGELLQIREILYMSDVVVLHVEMGEVGGKTNVVNVCDLIIVQVEDSEVSAH